MQQISTFTQRQSDEVRHLVGNVQGIVQASQAQAQEAERINRSMNEMDQVVQNNAALAEETAAASDELSAQAKMLDELVAYVAKLVGQAQLHQVPLSEQPHQHKLLPHRPSSVSLS